MRIKKFVAPTLKEASEQMKSEMGAEAIILNTRVIENDIRYGNRKMFELVSGIEDGDGVKETLPEGALKINNKAANFETELNKLTQRIYKRSENPVAEMGAKPGASIIQENIDTKAVDAELQEVIDVLTNRDVQKPIIVSILNQLKKYKSFLNSSNIDSYVLSSMSSLIPTTGFEIKKSTKPKVISLIGPTGVGKTTCIAKLAVISKILHNLDVGLISIDTFRLGAIDQLRIFSEISDIDLLVAYEPNEMPQLLKKFKNKDVVFIDTTGRSHKNAEHLGKIREFLSTISIDETFLVLNATTSTRNLIDVAEKFGVFEYDALLFTKIDEAITYGNILNVVSKVNVPVTFLTNGQVIPDDIISADPDFIAKMIFTGKVVE